MKISPFFLSYERTRNSCSCTLKTPPLSLSIYYYVLSYPWTVVSVAKTQRTSNLLLPRSLVIEHHGFYCQHEGSQTRVLMMLLSSSNYWQWQFCSLDMWGLNKQREATVPLIVTVVSVPVYSMLVGWLVGWDGEYLRPPHQPWVRVCALDHFTSSSVYERYDPTPLLVYMLLMYGYTHEQNDIKYKRALPPIHI